MKFIPKYYIILFVLLSTLAWSQKQTSKYHSKIIRQSTFNNVIKIEEKQITQLDDNYLIDQYIPQEGQIPIIYITKQLPTNRLAVIYPEFTRLVIITKNQSKIYKIYEFNRTQYPHKTDSITVDKLPKMYFKPVRLLHKDEIKIFYADYYGSTCCPRDLQWDNTPTRKEFISFFETKHNVKIINTYKMTNGKEGETTYFYTLKNLSPNLKLKFILDRDFYRVINRHLKSIEISPSIYTPFIVKMNDRMEKL